MKDDILFDATRVAFKILRFHQRLGHTPVGWEIGKTVYCQICKQCGLEPKLAEFSHGSYLGTFFGIKAFAHEDAPLLIRLKVDRSQSGFGGLAIW